MENSYGIGVRNRYELFYDEEVDPLELIKKTESKKNKKDKGAEKENQGKTAKTKDSVSGKKSIKNENVSKPIPEKASQTGNNNNNNTNITTTTTPNNNNNKQQQTQKPRSTERVKFSEREERNNQKNKPEEIKEPKETRENGAPQRFENESRGGRGGRGTGAPGGARGGRGARRGGRGGPGGLSGGSVGNSDFRGKREFDRQSGMVTSGVKPVDKRDGGGSYNWGSDKDQIEEQLQADHTTDLDTSGDNPEKVVTEEGGGGSGGGGGGSGSGGSAPPAPGEEDATRDEDGQREMTLDEWKALHKHEKPIFKTRRPGEGENTAQWKKTYVLKKKVDDQGNEEMIEVEVEEEEVHHGRKKVLLPIDFQFADTPTRGRGRGRGRGGPGGRGRGEGGRGRGRGFSRGFQAVSRQEAPKMDDERDFPSLG